MAYYVLSAANRWLGVRLEFMGTIVVTLASAFAVIQVNVSVCYVCARTCVRVCVRVCACVCMLRVCLCVSFGGEYVLMYACFRCFLLCVYV